MQSNPQLVFVQTAAYLIFCLFNYQQRQLNLDLNSQIIFSIVFEGPSKVVSLYKSYNGLVLISIFLQSLVLSPILYFLENAGKFKAKYQKLRLHPPHTLQPRARNASTSPRITPQSSSASRFNRNNKVRQIVHSRFTSQERPQLVQDCINESPQQSKIIPSQSQCPTCCLWKQWALEQEKNLVLLEEIMASKQMLLKERVEKLMSQAQSKDRILQQYNQQLISCRQQIAQLSQLVQEKDDRIQGLIKETQHASFKRQETVYATPLKFEPSSYRFDGEGALPSTHISQLLTTDEKKGRTCTTATKQNLQWSAFETNIDRICRQPQEKEGKLDKYMFENTMLKEYNAVLLDKLRETKFRRPF